jgi:hypothetical protein
MLEKDDVYDDDKFEEGTEFTVPAYANDKFE